MNFIEVNLTPSQKIKINIRAIASFREINEYDSVFKTNLLCEITLLNGLLYKVIDKYVNVEGKIYDED